MKRGCDHPSSILRMETSVLSTARYNLTRRSQKIVSSACIGKLHRSHNCITRWCASGNAPPPHGAHRHVLSQIEHVHLWFIQLLSNYITHTQSIAFALNCNRFPLLLHVTTGGSLILIWSLSNALSLSHSLAAHRTKLDRGEFPEAWMH